MLHAKSLPIRPRNAVVPCLTEVSELSFGQGISRAYSVTQPHKNFKIRGFHYTLQIDVSSCGLILNGGVIWGWQDTSPSLG